jgi:hypothetical protein
MVTRRRKQLRTEAVARWEEWRVRRRAGRGREKTCEECKDDRLSDR